MTRPDRSIEGKGGDESYFMNYYVAMTKRIHFGQHELGIHWQALPWMKLLLVLYFGVNNMIINN